MATRTTITQSAINAAPDKAAYLNAKFEKATPKSTVKLPNSFSEKGFYLLNTLHVPTDLWIEGAEDTLFQIFHKGPAIVFKRKGPTGRARLTNVRFLNSLNENNSREQHGIVSFMPIDIERCIVDNMWGDGIHLRGDGGNSSNPGMAGTDVSHSYIFRNTVRGCQHGIYAQGGDANAMLWLLNDARDNRGVGFFDRGYLGNKQDSNMGHYNAQGDYRVTDPNNYSTVNSCYSEGGSPASYFTGQCQVSGGLLDGAVILEGNATAHIDGNRHFSKHSNYPYRAHFTGDFKDIGAYRIKVFERMRKASNVEEPELIEQGLPIVGTGTYQWRLYTDQGGVFVDKSDSDFDSLEGAFEAVQSKIKVL